MHTDSPEERLLRLIRRKPRDPALGKEEGSKKIALFRSAVRDFIGKNKIVKPSSVKRVNRILLLCSIALSLYLLYTLFFMRVNYTASGVREETHSNRPAPVANKEGALPEKDDYLSYFKVIGEKELFKSSVQGGPEAIESDANLAQKFSLVGIIPGDKPQAIIEDKKTQKTYYLYSGQSFNGVLVEEITAEKVVLDCEGRKIVLVL